MKRSIEIYNDSVKKTFNFLKETANYADLWVKSMPIEGYNGSLIPVARIHEQDATAIGLLAKWREKHNHLFPMQFQVTLEGTKNWLKTKLLDVEDRILFFVVNGVGQLVGHLGFANAMNEECALEVDNVIRGEENISKGIMSAAVNTLIKWANETFWPEIIYLKTMEDNSHAIKFYSSLGFINDSYVPIEGIEKKYLKMLHRVPEDFKPSDMILTAGPSISAKEKFYAYDAVCTGWNTKLDYHLQKLETEFKDYLGVEHVLPTSSCTGALHIALASLDLKPGDEVIVPELTWVASANVALYVGATPVFADVDKDSWCLDPNSFESLINEKTKAVVPVHLYGHPVNMEKIMEIAKKHNLFVVEDAAPAIGAEWRGRKVATYGDFAGFSFQGAKLAVSGEGGALVINNSKFYEKAYKIWDQGRNPGTFWITDMGLKYKMSNVQAALALGQIERVAELIEAKRRIFSWYNQNLKGQKHIRLNVELPEAHSICWMTSMMVEDSSPVTRDQIRAELKKRNVDTRPIFPAISQYPYWPKKQKPMPVANWVGSHGINLPSGVCLKKEEVTYICDCIKDILKQG